MRSRHDLNDGSGKWGVFDAGVMGRRSTDLSEDEAHEQAADLNATLNQYGRRAEEDRREVNPPIAVELATWSVGGTLEWWVRQQWLGRVRGPDGRQKWITAADLRPAKET